MLTLLVSIWNQRGGWITVNGCEARLTIREVGHRVH